MSRNDNERSKLIIVYLWARDHQPLLAFALSKLHDDFSKFNALPTTYPETETVKETRDAEWYDRPMWQQ
jgi:hypothetical protein